MPQKMHTLKKNTLLDKDGKVAADGTGVTWLGLKGSQISVEQAERLGLTKKPAAKKPAAKASGKKEN